jgi:hypothetical protein
MWHFAAFSASQYFWSLSGAQRTLIGTGAEFVNAGAKMHRFAGEKIHQ